MNCSIWQHLLKSGWPGLQFFGPAKTVPNRLHNIFSQPIWKKTMLLSRTQLKNETKQINVKIIQQCKRLNENLIINYSHNFLWLACKMVWIICALCSSWRLALNLLHLRSLPLHLFLGKSPHHHPGRFHNLEFFFWSPFPLRFSFSGQCHTLHRTWTFL